jgi:hypothetical protein
VERRRRKMIVWKSTLKKEQEEHQQTEMRYQVAHASLRKTKRQLGDALSLLRQAQEALAEHERKKDD